MKLKILASARPRRRGRRRRSSYALGGLGASAADTHRVPDPTRHVGDVTDDVAATGSLAATRRPTAWRSGRPVARRRRRRRAARPTRPGPSPRSRSRSATPSTAATPSPPPTPPTSSATYDRATQRPPHRQDPARRSPNDAARGRRGRRRHATRNRQAQLRLYQRREPGLRGHRGSARPSRPRSTPRPSPHRSTASSPRSTSRRASTPRPARRSSSTPRRYQVTTDVVESDLADVEVGQAATVTIDAIDADARRHGHGDRPDAPATARSGVVSYPVTVTLDETPADAARRDDAPTSRSPSRQRDRTS